MKAPIHYYGGKTYQAAWILEVMKRYSFKTYIEPFGGSGAILFAKEPSRIEIYNDLYSDLVTLYKVLRNPAKFKDFIRFIENSPYSRELFCESKAALTKDNLSMVERAGHFFILIRQSFSSLQSTWASAGKCIKPKAKPYQNAIEHLSEVHERLKHVHIEHKDAIDCIKHYASPTSLIYCDPPYVFETRSSLCKYKHEYTNEQHKRLVETLLTVQGHKILSGYQTAIYQPLLDAGWTLQKKDFVCYTSPERVSRTECLYCSPNNEPQKEKERP